MTINPNATAFTAYVDLYGHYRALIAVLSPHLGTNAERLEAEIEAWWTDHTEILVDEGHRRLATMMGRFPPPEV